MRTYGTDASLVERAFELARSGAFARNQDLRRQLLREGFTANELGACFEGKQFRQKLKKLREEANQSGA